MRGADLPGWPGGVQSSDSAAEPTPEHVAVARAIERMTAAALAVQRSPTGASIASPCLSVCRIQAQSGLCEGCFRTIPEITAWSRADEADKRRIWRLIAQRAQTLRP